ncbi:hypothetical protein ColTof4_03675 [Colletotrichum tofieldiae]|nr:hypothetical protein ColTof3_12898 [Colletotrichum tofieldiae]GKT71252.1 hypothetical protein ColTof4_03675 [Colletotrichum tofieldiae]
MKFIAIAVLALVPHLTSVQASIAPGAASNCGDLGVMSYTGPSLAGVDAVTTRTCREHPLRVDSGFPPKLAARECWFGDDYGCTKGYCWEKCEGDGKWCWTAWNHGLGKWRSCSGKEDCAPNDTSACGQGGCDDCGCSCH